MENTESKVEVGDWRSDSSYFLRPEFGNRPYEVHDSIGVSEFEYIIDRLSGELEYSLYIICIEYGEILRTL